jgi:hypothetical protein
MMEIRQAVSTDVETITQFNIALCRETEGRELDPVTVTHGVRRFVSYPGSAWARTALEAPPPGSLSCHPAQARSSATDEANPGLKHHAA